MANFVDRRSFIKASAAVGLASTSIATADAQGFLRNTDRFSVASDDDNVTLMKKIFSKIALATSVGENTGRPGNSFLVLENPGIFLDPSLNLNTVRGARMLATLVDPLPNPKWIYDASSQSTSDVYKMTLNDKELPLVALTQDQKKALAKAKSDAPRLEKKYQDLAEQYWDANDDYLAAVQNAANHGVSPNPRYEFRKNQALNRWISDGHKLEYETAVATIYNLEALDPNNTWLDLVKLLQQNERADGTIHFYTTDVTPEYKTIIDPKGKGWGSFTFDQGDWENQSYHEHVDMGGGVGAGFGLWRVSAGAHYVKDQGYTKSQSSNISIACDLQRVRINRDWLRAFIYRSRAWRWHNGTTGSGSPISDGVTMNGETVPAGWMPLLPVALLVARNVSISADIKQDEHQWANSHLDASASVSYGPFSIGGHYSRDESSDYVKGSVRSDGITAGPPQIIGWYCDVFPASPNPDPLMPWPNGKSDAEFSNQYMSKYRQFRNPNSVMQIEQAANAYKKQI
jgi:hypothetical protein